MFLAIFKVVENKIQRRCALPAIPTLLAIFLVIPFILYCMLNFFLKFRGFNAVFYNKNSAPYLNELCPKPNVKAEYCCLSRDAPLDLSIIVPVYNAEAFLMQTIDSILKQKTQYKFEVIFVNDGSSDSSLSILNGYKYVADFSVISLSNSGVSCARNAGIQASKGRYLMFLDADDLLLEGSVELLLAQAILSGDEIVCGSYVSFSSESCDLDEVEQKNYSFLPADVCNESDWKYFDGYPWAKVYLRGLWEKTKFPAHFKYEDTIINAVLIRLAKGVSVSTVPVVAYRQHQASATRVLNYSDYSGIFVLWCVEYIIEENVRLNLSFDKYFFDIVAKQLTIYCVSRNRNAKLDTLTMLFSACCDKASEMQKYGYAFNDSESAGKLHLLAYQALIKRDFKRWYFYSLLSY